MTMAWSTGGKRAAPRGLRKVTEVPPGEGSPTTRGERISPAVASPASSTPAGATGHHRREGSAPVGNSRNMNPMTNTLAAQLDSPSAPTCLAAGRSPGKVAIPSTPYAEATEMNTSPPLSASMSQPMTLPARRTTRAPSVAYAAPAARLARLKARSLRVRSSRASKVRAAPASAASMSAARSPALARAARRDTDGAAQSATASFPSTSAMPGKSATILEGADAAATREAGWAPGSRGLRPEEMSSLATARSPWPGDCPVAGRTGVFGSSKATSSLPGILGRRPAARIGRGGAAEQDERSPSPPFPPDVFAIARRRADG